MCELQHGGNLFAAAIVGQDGAVWAQSASFPAITADQVTGLMDEFETPGTLASKTGLWIGDLKFMVVQGDPGVVVRGRARKDEEKGIEGKNTCIKKTTSALVIGISQDPTPAGDCNVVVENLGDYLTSQGI